MWNKFDISIISCGCGFLVSFMLSILCHYQIMAFKTVIITLMVIKILLTYAQDEGEDCILSSGIRGLCKRLQFCKRIRRTIYSKEPVKFKRCGYTRDGIELFCCLPSVDQATKACSRYEQDVYRKNLLFVSNGTPASAGEFPHMVALWYDLPSDSADSSSWKCGGSLISERFVLTAAHCILDGDPPIKVRMGDSDLASTDDDKGSREYAISKIIVHPRYNKRHSSYNDIALIKTNETVVFDEYVFPGCIETNSRVGSADYVISGWGALSGNNARGIAFYQPLRYAIVEHTEDQECNRHYSTEAFKVFAEKMYPRGIIGSQVCAKSAENQNRDACMGDSGGPLQYVVGDLYYIVGVVSFGKKCGAGDNPGVYTRVSNFAPWIDVFAWQK